MKKIFWHFFLISSLTIVNDISAQNLERFQNEVNTIVKRYADYSLIDRTDSHPINNQRKKPLAVFTGSSSIRFWTSLSYDFPEVHHFKHRIWRINLCRTFHYRDLLIGQYDPDIVVIYEGDNDVTGTNSVDEIFATASELYTYLTHELPETRVIILAAKPSPLRWSLKPSYDKLNSYFANYAHENEQFTYVIYGIRC